MASVQNDSYDQLHLQFTVSQLNFGLCQTYSGSHLTLPACTPYKGEAFRLDKIILLEGHPVYDVQAWVKVFISFS